MELVAPEVFLYSLPITRRQAVARTAVGVRQRQDHFRIQSLFVFHLHQPDDDSANQTTAGQRRTEHQRIEWVAVV